MTYYLVQVKFGANKLSLFPSVRSDIDSADCVSIAMMQESLSQYVTIVSLQVL